MSIDKLIDLLETKCLFFTPLSFFIETDPFEGCIPKKTLEEFASIVFSPIKDSEKKFSELKKYKDLLPPEKIELVKSAEAQLEQLKNSPRLSFRASIRHTAVNCWHQNDGESESMWRLYSDSGKGVALKTTVRLLAQSINTGQLESRISIKKVIYSDLNDPSFSSESIVMDGSLGLGRVKRPAFAHEREVRAIIPHLPAKTEQDIAIEKLFETGRIDRAASQKVRESIMDDTQRPAKGIRVSIDPQKLVQRIYISPFCKEPFASSVRAICRNYGIESDKVIESDLLRDADAILSALEYKETDPDL